MTAWQDLHEELTAWQADGRTATFWWRDDDAVDATPALERLLGLAERHRAPLGLAVIPARATETLGDRLAAVEYPVCVLQHGYAHTNHAEAGEKSTELAPHRSRVAISQELVRGRAMLGAIFGERAAPILVPPWNRVAGWFVPELAELGFRGLSTHTARAAAAPAKGLVACNTHLDVMRWRPRREFVGESDALALLVDHLRSRRRGLGPSFGDELGSVDPDEPSGILTHHLVMDEPAWRFVERLFAVLDKHPAARWLDAREAFALPTARPQDS